MSKKRLVAGAPDIDVERTIAELFHAIEELASRRKKPEDLEGIIAEAKTLAREWKDPHSAQNPKDRRPLFDGSSNSTAYLLAGLVVALRPDHKLVEQIRRHFPNELEKLSDDSLMADAMAAASIWASTQPQPTAKQKYERKRRRWRRNFFNSIEYQFGGAAEAEQRKPLSPLYSLRYEPTCLDDIFAGETVNMQRLEDLFFGIERHHLGKILQGKKRQYDWRDVVKIMDFLTSEMPRKKRKRPGRPTRKPWLNGLDLRTRVVSGIEARIKRIDNVLLSIALEEADLSKLTDKELGLVRTVFKHFRGYAEWQKKIADPFLAVVHRHLGNSGKKQV
jgi:hypothetical protein